MSCGLLVVHGALRFGWGQDPVVERALRKSLGMQPCWPKCAAGALKHEMMGFELCLKGFAYGHALCYA